jgi:predicted flap endonuclease-1-like 5' DNA nuclease
MNRVLRLLTVAGAVAGAVWYARQQGEQAPAPVEGEWAGRRNLKAVPEPVTAPAPAAAGADDLTEIKGIGPKYAQQLADLGITSFAALADSDPEDLSGRLDARAGVDNWITQAKARTQD